MVWKHENTAHGRIKTELGSAVLWLLAFPEESIPNVPCIGINWGNLFVFNAQPTAKVISGYRKLYNLI